MNVVTHSIPILIGGFLCLGLRYADDHPNETKWLYDPNTQQKIVAHATSEIDSLRMFKRLYPLSSFSLWPSSEQKPWTMVLASTVLYGRYEIDLTQRIHTRERSLSAQPVGPPHLLVKEYTHLEKGLSEFDFIDVAPNAWSRLVAARGDLAAIVPGAVKDRPLPYATKHLKDLVEGY